MVSEFGQVVRACQKDMVQSCEVDNSEVVSEHISMWGKLLVKTGWEQGSRLLFFDTEAY